MNCRNWKYSRRVSGWCRRPQTFICCRNHYVLLTMTIKALYVSHQFRPRYIMWEPKPWTGEGKLRIWNQGIKFPLSLVVSVLNVTWLPSKSAKKIRCMIMISLESWKQVWIVSWSVQVVDVFNFTISPLFKLVEKNTTSSGFLNLRTYCMSECHVNFCLS